MIRSFRDRKTAAVFHGVTIKGVSSELSRQAQRRLADLDGAETLDDLAARPGNRLERLQGDRQGLWSTRVNAQWRICFRWTDGDAWDVELVDYH